jgi:prepilin-type N-terminal cleavage/methylation domain-containing protein
MERDMHTKNQRMRGFTLVEIMIVIGIMSILLAVAIPHFVKARGNSYAKTCQSNLKNILGAKERWAMENNQDATSTPAMNELVQTYLKSTPQCPAGGTYTVGSMGELPVCNVGGTPGAYDAHIVP